MEPEYKIVKCPTCGQEKQGPRIIRLSEQHKTEWEQLSKKDYKIFRRFSIIIIISLLLDVLFGLATWYWAWHYFAFEATGSAVGLGFVGGIILYFLIWAITIIFLDKAGKKLEKRKTEILAQYGAKPEEHFEIV